MIHKIKDFNLKIKNEELGRLVPDVCKMIKDAGGRALLVGGGVRDSILGLGFDDVDVEVHGLDRKELKEVLGGYLKPVEIGKSYSVFTVRGLDFQISVAEYFPLEQFQESLHNAASRRDLTINALAYDLLTSELFDTCSGLEDLKEGLLRHVSSRFDEDPVRVLRIMQIAARYDFRVDPATVTLCKGIFLLGASRERIFPEWKKLLLQGKNISRGLNFLKDCGWLLRYYPGLEQMIGCRQDPEWHPEGDVWTHTLHCMDAFAQERLGDEYEDVIVGLAVLCHDIGKPPTTKVDNGRIRSNKHELVGKKLTQEFLCSITRQWKIVDEVLPLVRWHMVPGQYYRAGVKDGAIRKLATKVERIDRLVRVAKADFAGRPPLPKEPYPDGEWLLKKAEELKVEAAAPAPILMGRHLIEFGIQPSQQFGKILRKCYLAQLNGAFSDEDTGIAFLEGLLEEME